jgi:hypothetical protein
MDLEAALQVRLAAAKRLALLRLTRRDSATPKEFSRAGMAP